jgi:hypothetical protein
MPPMKTENLLMTTNEKRDLRDLTEAEKLKLLSKEFYIDVNDPRNQHIIHILKTEKNEQLQALLREDSLNPLGNIQPFRHKLLIARQSNVDFMGIEIPILEKEIVNDYSLIDKLDVLYRQEAERKFIKEQGLFAGDAVKSSLREENDGDMLKRKAFFIETVKRRQKEIKSGKTKAHISLKSVVKEF